MKPLVITSVRTAVQLPGPPCESTLYYPDYWQEPGPVAGGMQETLVTQGDFVRYGAVYPPADPRYPLSDRNRGADRLRLWGRPPGGQWRALIPKGLDHNIILTNHYFPWMGDLFHGDKLIPDAEKFLETHREAYIGATASPARFRIGDTNYMLCTATVGDPDATTTRQFTLFLWSSPVSSRWRNWRLVDMQRDHPNYATQRAVLWFGNMTAETVAKSGDHERGITAVTCHSSRDGYLYICIEVWTGAGIKNGLLRAWGNDSQLGGGSGQTRLDDGNGVLWSSLEIWTGAQWNPIINGELPSWFLADAWAGNPFPHIFSKIGPALPWFAPTPEHKYMLTATGSGSYFGKSGNYNCIEVAFSRDMVEWTPPQMVESRMPGFLDGTGYDHQCLNPLFTGERFMLATNDLGVMSGLKPQFGKNGCAGDVYQGLQIVECDVEVK